MKTEIENQAQAEDAPPEWKWDLDRLKDLRQLKFELVILKDRAERKGDDQVDQVVLALIDFSVLNKCGWGEDMMLQLAVGHWAWPSYSKSVVTDGYWVTYQPEKNSVRGLAEWHKFIREELQWTDGFKIGVAALRPQKEIAC